MDFTGLNSNPVVFDTSANVRKALSLEEEDDEVIDEVQRQCERHLFAFVYVCQTHCRRGHV